MTTNLEGYSMGETTRGLYTRTNSPQAAKVPEGTYKLDMVHDKSLDHDRMSDGEVMAGGMPPGFVSDFILAMRGREVTTSFAMWGALFGISCALQRRAWLEWAEDRLFPNLYLIFMAPPGINMKSHAVDQVTKLIYHLPDLFESAGDKEVFGLPVFDGSITPEGMFSVLSPRETIIFDEGDSAPHPLNLGSRMVLVADELINFMGAQKYNQGLIGRMISLYDCKDHDSKFTMKDKLLEMKNVFFNFFAGTTPESYAEVLPPEARGGGFLSRTILVNEPNAMRIFRRPTIIRGAPDREDLTRRLGWVAINKGGVYDLTDEADIFYENWYELHRRRFIKHRVENDNKTREDKILLKTATLIRAQSYTLSRSITLADIRLAALLVDANEKAKDEACGLLHNSEWEKRVARVTRHLTHNPDGLTRRTLMSWLSRYMKAYDLDEVLNTLSAAGQLKILLNDQPIPKTHQVGTEVYIWQETP